MGNSIKVRVRKDLTVGEFYPMNSDLLSWKFTQHHKQYCEDNDYIINVGARDDKGIYINGTTLIFTDDMLE